MSWCSDPTLMSSYCQRLQNVHRTILRNRRKIPSIDYLSGVDQRLSHAASASRRSVVSTPAVENFRNAGSGRRPSSPAIQNFGGCYKGERRAGRRLLRCATKAQGHQLPQRCGSPSGLDCGTQCSPCLPLALGFLRARKGAINRTVLTKCAAVRPVRRLTWRRQR